MNPAPPHIARARANACRRHGCTHDLSLSADLDASCPNGLWSAFIPGQRNYILNPRRSPSLLRQAVTAATAVVKHVAAGCPTRTPEEQAPLLAICHTCPRYDRPNNRCLECACYLSVKIPMALEKCPIGKW